MMTGSFGELIKGVLEFEAKRTEADIKEEEADVEKQRAYMENTRAFAESMQKSAHDMLQILQQMQEGCTRQPAASGRGPDRRLRHSHENPSVTR